MLAREVIVMNHKKLLRLYREENLRVSRRRGRKRAMGTRAPMTLPQGLNQRWSLDSVSDTLACSRRIGILAVVMTSRARTWRWGSTRRYPVRVLPGSSMRSSRSAASR